VLEDSMPADVNEMVLCDDGGELLEGMSSNFFAVTKDGTLVTADEGVLVCALTRTTIAPSSTEKPVHPPPCTSFQIHH
jgi:branched-subunit amino acid aminotransferase/4-amino-4-deoxychorismate lyase